MSLLKLDETHVMISPSSSQCLESAHDEQFVDGVSIVSEAALFVRPYLVGFAVGSLGTVFTLARSEGVESPDTPMRHFV